MCLEWKESTEGNNVKSYMSLVVRKPVFGVSDQVRHKPGCTTTEDSWRLEISYFCTIRVAKTKALISFAVTTKLICGFLMTGLIYSDT